MAVAPPPNTVPVHALEVKGEVDELYHEYFSKEPKAALLACDKVGVSTEELLFRSRAAWGEAIQRASHVRPVARLVDLEALTHLRFNIQERHRQQLFRDLYTCRRTVVESNKVEELWKQREEVLEANDLLRDQLEDPPLPASPEDEEATTVAAAPAGAPPGSTAATPAAAGSTAALLLASTPRGLINSQASPTAVPHPPPGHAADDASRRKSLRDTPRTRELLLIGDTPRGANAGNRSAMSTRSGGKCAPPPPPPPEPPFPSLPPMAPLCRRLTEENLHKEEALLLAALRQLTEFAHKQTASERKWKRDQKEKEKRRLEAPNEQAQDRPLPLLGPGPHSNMLSVNRSPRGLSVSAILPIVPTAPSLQPTPAGHTIASPRDHPSSARPHVGGSGVRPAEKEFAVLVRNTMTKIAQHAIADQQYNTLLDDVNFTDANDARKRQAQLRRYASSPAAHSVAGSKTYVAQRPDTDGLPSDEVSRVRRERAKMAEYQRAEHQMEADERRGERSEQVKHRLATKGLLVSQSMQARREVILQNRDRALRAAEAQRLSTVEEREKRRGKATELHRHRRDEAEQLRQQHVEMEGLRRKFADVVERMAVLSQWDVPDDLRGLIATGGSAPGTSGVTEEPAAASSHHRHGHKV
jgi:hypothetical protein